jgi:hypothetical protein
LFYNSFSKKQMKFTSVVSLAFAAVVKADIGSLQDYLPRDGADFISTCDQESAPLAGDQDGNITRDEFLDCMSGVSAKELRRIERTVDREWSYISNSSSVIGEDEARALYWSFICSDSDEAEQDACAVGHIHSWIDDITACPTADDAGCTITVPSGRDDFIADLAIEGAFRHMDGGSTGDGTLDSDEQAWFNLRLAVSSWSEWAPSGLIPHLQAIKMEHSPRLSSTTAGLQTFHLASQVISTPLLRTSGAPSLILETQSLSMLPPSLPLKVSLLTSPSGIPLTNTPTESALIL